MKSPSFAACLFISILFGACAGSPPGEQAEPAPTDQLTVGKVQTEIKVGMSGAAVIEALGSPNMVSTDDKRREVWVYDKVSTERWDASRSSYGTLILIGGRSDDNRSSTRQRTLTIIIKFDEQKMVRDFGYNYTQF